LTSDKKSFSQHLLILSVLFPFREAILKAVVIVVVLMIRIFQGCSFTGQSIMIGNSVTSELRATAHGFAMTTVCAARLVWKSICL
jgi:hypothetical protein